MKQQSESEITKAIRAVLKTCGFFSWKQWQGPMSQPKGVADILGILPDGRMFAIEVKRPGWTPPGQNTKAFKHHQNQQRFIDTINANGGVAFFATSIDDVIAGLGIQDRFLF
jgi:hypothetical protein